MTDFTEIGTMKRKAHNAGLMQVVYRAMKGSPKTTESLVYKTGLTLDQVTMALNLLHTKDQVVLNGGLWYSDFYLRQTPTK